jgi:hypothetical protein
VSAVLSGIYSIYVLVNLVSAEQVPDALRKILVRFRFIRTSATIAK